MEIYKYIKAHDTLNTKLWDGFVLKEDVEKKIKEIVNFFVDKIKSNEIKIVVKDIWLLGSNTSYNYNENSDLDVHIMVNVNDSSELMKLYNTYRILFREIYTPIIKDIPVEIYFEEYKKATGTSEAVYSLEYGWLKKPIKGALKINSQEANAKYESFIEEFNSLQEKISHEDLNYQLEEIDNLLNRIYELRSYGLSHNGEFSLENIVFKELRSKGYIDALRILKRDLENKLIILK